MSAKRAAYFALILALGIVLTACERTRIGDITADPGRFMNKEVKVAGEVTQSIGILGRGVYQIDDGTGKLWIFSNGRGVPSKGAKVGVKGLIKQSVTLMGTNYATIMEERGRTSASD